MRTHRAAHRKFYIAAALLNLVFLAVLGPSLVLGMPSDPSETGLYSEDFTSYQFKDFTENVDWDIWARALHLQLTDSAPQYHPRSAVDTDGNVIVVWESGNIYAQKMDENGNRLWEVDAQVNYDSMISSNDQGDPGVAIDQNGNAVVVWRETRGGDLDIYAQKLDRGGKRLWTSDVRVNSELENRYQSSPVVVTDESGNAIVAWSDDRGGEDIYAQKLDANGNKLWNGDIRVNSDTTFEDQWGAAIAVNRSGKAVVVWHDERNGDPDIYAQILDSGGNKQLAGDLRVNSDGGIAYQGYPSVVFDEVGESIIVWDDERNGDGDIYAQKLDNSGSKLWTADVRVNTDAGTAGQSNPALSLDTNGNAIVVWVDFSNSKSQIYAQALDENKNKLWTADVHVSLEFGTAGQSDPDVSVNMSGNVFIVWDDQRNNNYDIYAQNLTEVGNRRWAVDYRVNSPNGIVDQWSPVLAIDGNGNAIIAWQDNRHGRASIFGQRIDKNGDHLWTSEVQINSAGASIGSGFPALALDQDGSAIILWVDYRNGYADIFAQKLDVNGNKLWAGDVRVNSYIGSEVKESPAVATDLGGNVTIVWKDNRGGKADIYAQKLDSSGARLWATDVLVNYDSGSAKAWSPVIAIDSSGNSIVAWEDRRNYDGDILAQKLDSDGNKLWAGDVRVDSDAGTAGQITPEMTIDTKGNAIIVWQDFRNGNADIYAQKLNTSGNKLWMGDQLVNSDGAAAYQEQPSIGMDSNDECVIVWSDWRNSFSDPDIYAQRLDTGGNKLWSIDLRVNSDSAVSNQWDPSIAVDQNGNAIIAWADDRNGNKDVYAQWINQFGDHIWLNDLQVIFPDRFYMLNGLAQSLAVNTAKDNIQQAILSANYQSNDGNVEFYLTNNGGLDWFPVTPGTTHVFTTVGEDLRWKCKLTANPAVSGTPVVEWVHIDYHTAQNGVVYVSIALKDYISYFVGPWEHEDNDQYQQANGPIMSGKDYFGLHDDSSDYFSVYLLNAGSVTINMTSDHGETDSRGRSVVQTQLYYLSTDNLIKYQVGSQAHIEFAGQSGRYYVRVYTVPEYVDSEKQYTLNVTYP
jgi:hypothetical protein